MTQTILNGGSKTQQDQYAGPARELTVDDSNQDLRLHDGATPGGHAILNRDNADERYQARSAELDGFSGHAISDRGFWTRLGPADYRLRKITVNGSDLTITNPDGFADDPYISLADTIGSDHTWNGQHLFTDVVQFNAGINADVSGDTFGTHTGGVVGDVVGDVVGNTTGTHTGPTIGDVDIRGHAILADNESIPWAAIADVPAAANPIPVGAILMWSGDETDVPDGWFLCDGLNGTPDLTGHFIIGSNATYAAHSSGGSATHSHTITVAADGDHTHNITVAAHTLTTSEIPAHHHGSGVCDTSSAPAFNHGTMAASPVASDNVETSSADGTVESLTSDTGGGAGHSHGGSSATDGNHTHGASSATASSLPPYYALCFIMKGA